MILSDRSIRDELTAGRIKLEPSDDSLIQPASVDVRLDRYFRVFLNHTMPVIDVKKNLEELTRLVEIDDDRPFVLHPGEFVLGSTLERVALPDDLVARIEGKSSLGRLGLLIHSSLPSGEEVLVRDRGGVRRRRIGELVKDHAPCEIVGFDPETFEVGYHEVTGFYEGPEDKIYEVRLASGRCVRVTAGHNLFTVGDDGELRKVRTAELSGGVEVAVARRIPDPPDARATIERGHPPLSIEVDVDLAWTIGMCVAKGHERDGQVVIATNDQARLDRLHATFARLRLPAQRAAGAVTCCSTLLSGVFGWTGMGGPASSRRTPPAVFGWPLHLIEAFLEGLDGGSVAGGGASVCTTSEGLVSDVLLLFARLGRPAGFTCNVTPDLALWTLSAPDREHELPTRPSPASRPGRLADGGLAWDRVVEVIDTGEWERIYDIEVLPGGRRIQNFLAGKGGVFVSNTAGFIDAGFDGHITLELSNVANLPITLYPGMKIGQISFLRMTTPADVPYGQGSLRSKYQGQRGPTPSRYWENFEDD